MTTYPICCVNLPYLLWQFTPYIVTTYPIYCDNLPHILWQFTPYIVTTYPIYCDNLPHILWQLTPYIVTTYPIYCDNLPHILWQLTPYIVTTYAQIVKGPPSYKIKPHYNVLLYYICQSSVVCVPAYCVHIWFVSCPCLVWSLVKSVPAVFV